MLGSLARTPREPPPRSVPVETPRGVYDGDPLVVPRRGTPMNEGEDKGST